MTAPVKIALVEIGGSHDECLYTQVRALASEGHELYWITSTVVKERNPHLAPYFTDTLLIDTTGKAIADVRKMKQIVRYLKDNKIEKVVFNTAQGGHVRNLALLMPKNITCYGIVHTLRKFQNSFTQKIIHRMIRHYAVLSDDLLKKVDPIPGINVTSFYPIDFPHFTQDYAKSGILVALTGGVENRRKDLSRFGDMCAASPEQVHFVFLGKSDPNNAEVQAFVADLEQRGLRERVTLFPHFVEQELFDAVLRQTDFLLPLIHPGTPSADEYISYQITGAFTLAFAYHIPLLIHEAYRGEQDLVKTSMFYQPENFGKVMEEAIEKRDALAQAIATTEKWQLATQQAKYRAFIGV